MISLGIDIGTSGIRAVILNKQHQLLAQSHILCQSKNPVDWWNHVRQVIFKLKKNLSKTHSLNLSDITHLAVDGTSGTVLLADKDGIPCSQALMYYDQRAIKYAQMINDNAPENTAARGAASGLAKILWLYKEQQDNYPDTRSACYALNQADWITSQLTKSFGISDHNNALKMGYDAELKCWPDWLHHYLHQQQIPINLLPEVMTPGEIISEIDADIANNFGFSAQLKICAGTTDSTAAIIASGANHPGDAVTSLGSTLVMKVITEKPVFNTPAGVYSQPYGDYWLAGGASNSGGNVLQHFFSAEQLTQFTEQLNLTILANDFKLLDLNYYPLLSPGERFPIQEHQLTPRMSPRPEQDIAFFQALLEGMADIEHHAYLQLLELGVPYPKHVISIGGGALNQAWQSIRQSKLGIPVKTADLQQAAAGSAILAQSTW